ncbi:MAG: hypothetical protein RSC43_01105 [Clostridia bacterium]
MDNFSSLNTTIRAAIDFLQAGDMTPDRLKENLREAAETYSLYGPSVEMLKYHSHVAGLIDYALKCNFIDASAHSQLMKEDSKAYECANEQFSRYADSGHILSECAAFNSVSKLYNFDPMYTHSISDTAQAYALARTYVAFMHSEEGVQNIIDKISSNYTHYIDTNSQESLHNVETLLGFMKDMGAISAEDYQTFIGRLQERLGSLLGDILDAICEDAVTGNGKSALYIPRKTYDEERTCTFMLGDKVIHGSMSNTLKLRTADGNHK